MEREMRWGEKLWATILLLIALANLFVGCLCILLVPLWMLIEGILHVLWIRRIKK